MEPGSLLRSLPEWIWPLLAGVLATLAGSFVAEWACQAARRKRLAASMLAPTGKDQLLLRMRGGFKPLRGASERILRSFRYVDNAMENAAIILEERSLAFTKEALLSLLLCASIVAVLAGWLFSGSPAFGIALGCIVLVGTMAYVNNVSDKRNLSMRENVPEALRTLSTSFRSGHTLPQTLAASAKESGGYLGRLFSIAADRLEMGSTPAEALSVMRGNPRVPELSFVAVALDVQHESGGSIAPVLESAMESVEGELALIRSLRVQTAQARLSASIVTVMPFILIALFSLMSPDFLSPFFSSALGIALLALALVMQVSGVLLVRRMLKVDVS